MDFRVSHPVLPALHVQAERLIALRVHDMAGLPASDRLSRPDHAPTTVYDSRRA
jgi:hypothetical protein